MESKNYLKAKLGELHSKFSNLSIKYQYDPYTQNHIVEVKPLSEFETNDEYAKHESELSHEFDNKFFPESVMFVSEDSLSCVKYPELVLYPVLAKSFVNISYPTKHSFKFSNSDYTYTSVSVAFAA